jgi:DNA-binding MarR family transcriptional regulator
LNDHRPNISDAEWRVMHEVWQTEPVTSAEITSRLSQSTDWSAGTIKTLLHRLVQKQILDFRRKEIGISTIPISLNPSASTKPAITCFIRSSRDVPFRCWRTWSNRLG